jgi:hypothetical protein
MAETTTTISKPAPFIETMGQTFGEGVTRLAGKPISTTPFAPTVAGQGALGQAAQQAAVSQAGLGQLQFDPTTGAVTGVGAGQGIAGYQQYLDAAKGYGTAMPGFGTAAETQAAAAAGQVAPMGAYGTTAAGLTGAISGAQLAAYESPYTNQVITAMRDQMADVKAQQDIKRNTQAVGAGAFGGARQGVAQSVADTEYNRMIGQMTAQQEQAGFGQAQQARQQDYMNQLGLGQYTQGIGQYQSGLAQQQLGLGQYQQGMGQYQQGMAQLQPQLAYGAAEQLGQYGQQDLAYRQAIADTQAQAAQMAAYEPYQRYGFMGEQLTGLMGGYPGGTRMTTQPSASPMQQMLGMGIMGGLGYAGMKGAGMF